MARQTIYRKVRKFQIGPYGKKVHLFLCGDSPALNDRFYDVESVCGRGKDMSKHSSYDWHEGCKDCARWLSSWHVDSSEGNLLELSQEVYFNE